MKNKLAILIDLLPWISAHPGVSLKEASKHFDVPEKQIIDLLQMATFTGPGQAGGELVDIDFEDVDSLFVADAKGLNRPVRFDSVTASAAIAGLGLLQQLPGLFDVEQIKSLQEKLKAGFKLPDDVLAVQINEANSNLVADIKSAISNQVCLQISYTSGSSGQTSSRVIEPISLFVRDAGVYVVAWCHAALAIRHFRLDRIAGCEILQRKQENQDELEVQSARQPVSAVVQATNLAALNFDSEIIVNQRVLNSDSVELTLAIHTLDWIVQAILGSGGQVIAVEPPELISAVNEKLAKFRSLNDLT